MLELISLCSFRNTMVSILSSHFFYQMCKADNLNYLQDLISHLINFMVLVEVFKCQ